MTSSTLGKSQVQVKDWRVKTASPSDRVTRFLFFARDILLDNLWWLIASNPFQPVYFKNWTTNIRTRAPILRPRNDAGLRKILAHARATKSKVRVMGSGHSVAPSVTSTAEAENGDVLIIQLNRYSARPVPDLVVDPQTLRVWVNAGWSLDILYQRMRKAHSTILLPSQTAGPFFALGGVVANCVHGGNVGFGLLNDAVTAMRMMDASGNIREIRDEPTLRLLRASLGQLGIITHVELQCISVVSLKAKHLITSTASAAVVAEEKALESAGCVAALSSTTPSYAYSSLTELSLVRRHILTQLVEEPWQEYFWHPYTGKLLRIAWSPSTQKFVDPLVMSRGMAAGAPKLKFLDLFSQDLPILGEKSRWSKEGCTKVIDMAFSAIQDSLETDRITDGDMFYLEYATESIFLAYFIPVDPAMENVARALSVVAEVAKDLRDSDAPYKFDLPVEFRFVRGGDRCALSPVYTEGASSDPANAELWLGIEIPTFTGGKIDPTFKNQSNPEMVSFLNAFARVEAGWRAISPRAQPHYGKLFGLKKDAHGVYSAFDRAVCAGVVSEGRKAAFRAEMARVDPQGLFRREFGDALVGL